MKIVLAGSGRMGCMIRGCAEERGIEVAGMFGSADISGLESLGRADAIIDFSAPAALPAVCAYVRRTGTPLVSGTTGYSAEEEAALASLGSCAPVVASANYSIGVAVLRYLTAEAARLLAGFDVEISETHHRMKKDAPSGTAKMLLAAVDPQGTRPVVHGRSGLSPRQAGEIGMHSLRGGTVAGFHAVSFFGDEEEVTLTHRAESRRIFALGALRAAELLQGAPAGLVTLDELLFRKP